MGDTQMKTIDRLVEKLIRGFHLYGDIWLGVFLSILSAFMFWQTFSFKVVTKPSSPLDTAKFAPQLVFGALGLCGLILIVQGALNVKKKRATLPSEEQMARSVLVFKRSFVGIAGVGLFVLLLPYLGFIPCAILYMIGNMLFMGAKKEWKPKTYVIVAVLVTLFLYFTFRQFMYVKLPAGILKGVL